MCDSQSPLKTKNSYRAVSISPQAIEVLREQKRKTNDQYVFPSPNGGPISPDSVNNMLKRVLERAGIPKVRFPKIILAAIYDMDRGGILSGSTDTQAEGLAIFGIAIFRFRLMVNRLFDHLLTSKFH